MVVTSSTGEDMSDKVKSRNKSSFHVRRSPDPGLPENFLTSLFKRSTGRPKISCVGARWTANWCA